MPASTHSDTLERVRALGPGHGGDVPVAAVTALGGASYRQLALAQGFEAHMAKPVAPDELVAMVRPVITASPTPISTCHPSMAANSAVGSIGAVPPTR